MSNQSFKQCPCCEYVWDSREDFLSDSSLRLNGYQADLDRLEEGLLFFTHEQGDCHSILAIEVSELMDLYQGPRYQQRLWDTEQCPRYCRQQTNLQQCNAMCECAFVRELIQMLKHKETLV